MSASAASAEKRIAVRASLVGCPLALPDVCCARSRACAARHRNSNQCGKNVPDLWLDKSIMAPEPGPLHMRRAFGGTVTMSQTVRHACPQPRFYPHRGTHEYLMN